MTFFNTKEEVLNIELTQYGKHLLSKGKWYPAYYEFYDDDIIYDTEYAGYIEKQEEAQERIKNTVRPKIFYSFEGSETRIKEQKKQLLENNDSTPILEKNKKLSKTSLPLGNSAIEAEKNPSWQVKILNGEIEYVTSSVSITGLPNTANIIELRDVEYKTYVSKDEEEYEKLDYPGKKYEDGSFVIVKENYLLLDVNEKNVNISNEYFDLEIFLLESGSKGQIEIPLRFANRNNQIIDDLYVGDEEIETERLTILGVSPVDSAENQFAEFYFDVHIDREIDGEILCKHISKAEIEKLKIKDGYLINCRETKGVLEEEMPIMQARIDSNVTQDDLDRFEDC